MSNHQFTYGWADVKPTIKKRNPILEFEDMAWDFQQKIADVFCDAEMEYGDDQYLFIKYAETKAAELAQAVQHGHHDIAAYRLADIVNSYMDYGVKRSKFADRVFDLCQEYAMETGINSQAELDGQVDVDRPGLF